MEKLSLINFNQYNIQKSPKSQVLNDNQKQLSTSDYGAYSSAVSAYGKASISFKGVGQEINRLNDLILNTADNEVISLIAQIHEHKGKQLLYLKQKPQVLEQLIETMKPTTENTPSMGETIPPKVPSSAQTQDVVIQKPNVPQDTNTIPEPPKTRVDTYQENTINITKDESTAVERLNITKDTFNKKTSSPVVNPALVGTIIAATGIGAVSTISRNQKKKTQK